MFSGLEFAAALTMICRLESQDQILEGERLCEWRCQDQTKTSRYIGKENNCPKMIYEPQPNIPGIYPDTGGNEYPHKNTSPRIWNNRDD